MSIPRVYVDGLSRVEPDKKTGLVKLTFNVNEPGGKEDAVQIVINVEALNQVFQKVGEKMQATFGGGPGGRPGNRGGGRPPGERQGGFRDLTQD
jgi:hypothetical protein